jgi:hypothetical protein
MEKLIDIKTLRETHFADPKPSVRTLQRFKQAKLIPCIKIAGGMVRFDPNQVRAALVARNTI